MDFPFLLSDQEGDMLPRLVEADAANVCLCLGFLAHSHASAHLSSLPRCQDLISWNEYVEKLSSTGPLGANTCMFDSLLTDWEDTFTRSLSKCLPHCNVADI